MTREDAIEVLKLVDENVSCDDCLYYAQMEDCPTDEDCIIVQAVEMAIQALSQEPCDDAISREAVLRLIENKPYDWSNLTERHNMLMEIRKLPSVTQKSDKYRKEAKRWKNKWLMSQKSGKWISVNERLPEDGAYLVTVERIDGNPRIDMKSFAKDLNKVDEFDFPKHKCGWYDYDSEYGYWEDNKVIAWMPLPEPYKAESEE